VWASTQKDSFGVVASAMNAFEQEARGDDDDVDHGEFPGQPKLREVGVDKASDYLVMIIAQTLSASPGLRIRHSKSPSHGGRYTSWMPHFSASTGHRSWTHYSRMNGFVAVADGATENRYFFNSNAKLIVNGTFPEEWMDDGLIPKDHPIAYFLPRFDRSDLIVGFVLDDTPHLVKQVVNALERTDFPTS
jgi:hypothetical protein